ncbi:YcgN family cysteine cluster protein [Marinobacteraceae bacterium S3BR75-40.1]
MVDREHFWERKSLREMSPKEWESLCDGCGKCCLQKLQDEDTEVVHYTHLACQYLDQETCRCSVYPERLEKVPECVDLTPDELDAFKWLPASCAYRRLSEGRGLPDWHPLLTGSSKAMHEGGHSVQGRTLVDVAVPEEEWDGHIIHWVS